MSSAHPVKHDDYQSDGNDRHDGIQDGFGQHLILLLLLVYIGSCQYNPISFNIKIGT